MASSSDKKKEEKVKIGALLKLQNTNGSFELTENFCKTIGLPYAAINKRNFFKNFLLEGVRIRALHFWGFREAGQAMGWEGMGDCSCYRIH